MAAMVEAQPAILRPAEIEPRARGGGARTIPLVSPGIGARSLLNGITEFDPGAAIPLHFHNCEESVMILDGRAICHIDGKEFELGPNDTTWLPANVPHYFRNASSTEKMRIFWTYARTDATRSLVETGETRPVSQEHGDG